MRLSNPLLRTALVYAMFAASLLALGMSRGAIVHAQFAPTDNGSISNKATDNGGVSGSPTDNGGIKNNPTDNGGAACGGGEGVIANPLKFCSLEQLLDGILDAAIKLGTVVLTLALIWTGFKFVAARGAEEKIREARTALMWTVIGGLILLGAKAIELVISSTVTSLTP